MGKKTDIINNNNYDDNNDDVSYNNIDNINPKDKISDRGIKLIKRGPTADEGGRQSDFEKEKSSKNMNFNNNINTNENLLTLNNNNSNTDKNPVFLQVVDEKGKLKDEKQSIPKKKGSHYNVHNLPKEIQRKYRILINSLSFDDDNKLENNIVNKFEVSPYELMFEFCYKRIDPRKKAKYEIFKKCQSILEKASIIEYIIKKNMEINFLREFALTTTENNMFKFHFKPLNVLNYEESMFYLKKIKSEGIESLTKDDLIDGALQKNNKVFEVFYDYFYH